MGQLSLPTETLSRRTPEVASERSVLINRLTLVAAVVLTAAVALGLTLALTPAPQVEPDLLRLLRGMVLIKGLLALAAGALVWWRLGRPITPSQARGYVAALCLSTAALAWLWGLHLMLIGALPFYVGLAGLYLVGRRDPLFTSARARLG